MVAASNTCDCKATFTRLDDLKCKPEGDCFKKYNSTTNRWVDCGTGEVKDPNDETSCLSKTTCPRL